MSRDWDGKNLALNFDCSQANTVKLVRFCYFARLIDDDEKLQNIGASPFTTLYLLELVKA